MVLELGSRAPVPDHGPLEIEVLADVIEGIIVMVHDYIAGRCRGGSGEGERRDSIDSGPR